MDEFSIDVIANSIEKNGRYLSVDYPGIPTAKSFHSLESNPTYLGLHDEVHRQFISTIPNPIYSAFIASIKMVKEITGFKWSRELWDAMDMEVGDFLNFRSERYQQYDVLDVGRYTRDYIKLLNANVYSQNKSAGLFTASPYIDTTWLLLIDMVQSPDKWTAWKIDFNSLSHNNAYRILYSFTLDNKEKLTEDRAPAEQVVLLKSAWFALNFPDMKDVRFIKEEIAEKPRHIQVKIGGDVVVKDKNEALKIYDAILNANANQLVKMFFNNMDVIEFALNDPTAFTKAWSSVYRFRLIEFMRTDLGKLYKDKIIKAVATFTIKSIYDLEDNYQAGPYWKEIVFYYFKFIKKLGELKRRDFAHLYVFLTHYPQFENENRQSIFISHPELEEAFKRVDENSVFLNSAHIDYKDSFINAISDLSVAKVLNDSIIECFKSLDGFSINLLTVSILELNHYNLFCDENLNILLKLPSQSSLLVSAIDQLNKLGILSENRESLIDNPYSIKLLVSCLYKLKNEDLYNHEYREVVLSILKSDEKKSVISVIDSWAELNKKNLLTANNRQLIISSPANADAIAKCIISLTEASILSGGNQQAIIDNFQYITDIANVCSMLGNANLLTQSTFNNIIKNVSLLGDLNTETIATILDDVQQAKDLAIELMLKQREVNQNKWNLPVNHYAQGFAKLVFGFFTSLGVYQDVQSSHKEEADSQPLDKYTRFKRGTI